MITIYDKYGNNINEFDESNIIALHKFNLNKKDNYNFEYEYIFNSYKSKIKFDNNEEIFEVFYKGLRSGYYTEKYYLICEIGSLDKLLSENFNATFKTYFERINSYGELYIENSAVPSELRFDEIDTVEIDTVYILKGMPIIQFASSKGNKFEGLDKYTNYSIINNLESKIIFQKLRSDFHEELK